MTHDPEPLVPGIDEAPRPFAPLSLPLLLASIGLIALGAVALVASLAVVVVLSVYADVGLEGLRELYQDLRFDLAFKTEVGAVVVGTFYASLAAATLAAARRRGGANWRHLIAWHRARRGRPTTVLIVAATVAYAGLTTHVLTLAQHRPVINVEGPTNYLLLGTFAGNLVIMAPFAEELFFRGWLFTQIRARLPFWPTLLTTAALFAAIHLDRVFLVLPLALAAGTVREMTGSVKPAIALHVAYNLVIVTVKLWET